jgi:hypothetical protein
VFWAKKFWAKKEAAQAGGPKSREETPKEAYAASLLHCNI